MLYVHASTLLKDASRILAISLRTHFHCAASQHSTQLSYNTSSSRVPVYCLVRMARTTPPYVVCILHTGWICVTADTFNVIIMTRDGINTATAPGLETRETRDFHRRACYR